MTDKEKPRTRRGSIYPYGRGGKVYIKDPTAARSCAIPIEEEARNAAAVAASDAPQIIREAPPLPDTRPQETSPEPTLPEPQESPETEGEERDAAYEEYLRQNPASGLLKVQAYRAREALPQSGVGVTVSTYIGDSEREFFRGVTDENGLIDNIRLPAPPRGNSLESGDSHPTATYLLNATADGFIPITIGITVFDGIKTIQPLPMILRLEERDDAAGEST